MIKLNSFPDLFGVEKEWGEGVKVGWECLFCFARFTYRTGGLEHQHPPCIIALYTHELTWSLVVFIFQAPRVELQKIT